MLLYGISDRALAENQLRWMVGLLTGHCHLKGHLFKLVINSPISEMCLEDEIVRL